MARGSIPEKEGTTRPEKTRATPVNRVTVSSLEKRRVPLVGGSWSIGGSGAVWGRAIAGYAPESTLTAMEGSLKSSSRIGSLASLLACSSRGKVATIPALLGAT